MKRPLLKMTALMLVVSLFVLIGFNCFAEITVYTSSDGLWIYTLINGNEAFIGSGNVGERAYLGSETDVTIPAYIDGHKVFGISEYAFAGIDSISSISVESGTILNHVDFEQSMPTMSDYFCFKGSQADEFAKQNSFLSDKIHYFGDVNSDESIDLADYALIVGYLSDAETAAFSQKQIRASDYNGDCAVDAFDLFAIDKRVNTGMHIGNGDDDDDSHYAIIDWG